MEVKTAGTTSSGPPPKKAKLNHRSEVGKLAEERRRYHQERLNLERQEKRDKREDEKLRIKRAKLQLQEAELEVTRELVQAVKESNKQRVEQLKLLAEINSHLSFVRGYNPYC